MGWSRPTWWSTFTASGTVQLACVEGTDARGARGTDARNTDVRGADARGTPGRRPGAPGTAGRRAGVWRTCAAAAGLLLLGATTHAQQAASPSGLGRPPSDAERRDRIVGPDGADLPPGRGNAAEGAMVFARRGCSNCHGPTGSEGPSIQLVGGDVTSFTNYWPIRHWPFAPSIWDYIRRVMPYDRPGILTNDETYAVTAYLLYRNGIIGEEDEMDAESLPQVRMPQRDDYVRPEDWTPESRRGFEILPDR